MNKLIILSFFLVASANLVQAQHDPIIIEKNKFFYQDQRVTPKQMLEIVRTVPEALELMSKAKSNYTLASVIGFTGGFLVGWPLGAAIGGGDPNWALIGIGAGIILISIPIQSASNNKATQAVEIYNESIAKTSSIRSVHWQIGGTSNGLGILLKF